MNLLGGLKIFASKPTNLLSTLLIQFFLFEFIKKTPMKDIILSISQYFKKIINSLTSRIPFSIGDVFYIILGIVILSLLAYFIISIIKNKTNWKPTCYLLIIFNIIYFIYAISFGVAYDNRRYKNYNTSSYQPSSKDIETIAYKVLNECITLRETVQEDENKKLKLYDKNVYIQEIYNTNGMSIHPNVKTSLFSKILMKTGISGYYNPFTNEAQIVNPLPEVEKPFVLAHEIGHQKGITKEYEANFFAFLSGIKSSNTNAVYSAKYMALKYLISDLLVMDKQKGIGILTKFSPKMKQDYEDEKAFYQNLTHTGVAVMEKMNDSYLKINGEDGIVSYSYVSKMIILYYNNQSI